MEYRTDWHRNEQTATGCRLGIAKVPDRPRKCLNPPLNQKAPRSLLRSCPKQFASRQRLGAELTRSLDTAVNAAPVRDTARGTAGSFAVAAVS